MNLSNHESALRSGIMALGDGCRNLRVARRRRARPEYEPGKILLWLSLHFDGVRLAADADRVELIQDFLPEQTVKMDSEALHQLSPNLHRMQQIVLDTRRNKNEHSRAPSSTG